MRSTGCTLEAVVPSRWVTLGGREIPVRCLKYREPVSGAPLYVFKLIWLPEESPIQPQSEREEKRALWVKMALSRLPSPPGAVLLARVQRVTDFETAWDRSSRGSLCGERAPPRLTPSSSPTRETGDRLRRRPVVPSNSIASATTPSVF